MSRFADTAIRRQAAQYSEPPDALASRVLTHIGRSSGQYSGQAWATLDFEMVCLHRAMASAFGAQHGLVRTSRAFSIEALRDGRKQGRYSHIRAEWPVQRVDHAEFYRTPDWRVAAVVAHRYGLNDDTRQRCAAWAARHGLQAAFPTDFPSWWYPGWTQLVLYTRRAAPAGQLHDACTVIHLSEHVGRQHHGQ